MGISIIRLVLFFLTISTTSFSKNIDFDLYLTNSDLSEYLHISENEIIPLQGQLQIKIYSKQDGLIDVFYESTAIEKNSLLDSPIEIKAGQLISLPTEDQTFNLDLTPGEVSFSLAFTSENETLLTKTNVIAFDLNELVNGSIRDSVSPSSLTNTDAPLVYKVNQLKQNFNTLININEKVSNINGDLNLRGSHIYSDIARGTVLIANFQNGEFVAHGSGILLDDQHIITNLHVVYESDELYVVPYGGPDVNLKDMSMHYATILKVSYDKDLALLQTDPISDHINLLNFADEASISVGMNTHAVGHPDLQETWTYAKGYVSNLRKNYVADYDEISLNANVIQNSTDVIPGFSGGPLTNEMGEVIGINSFIMPDGFQYAVTSREVFEFLKKPNDFNGWTGVSSNSSGSSSNGDGLIILDDNSLEGYDCYDENKDGMSDYCGIDSDNSGYYEAVYRDIDFDGSYDEFRLDANENEVDELVITIAGSSKYQNTYDKYYYDLQDDGSGFDQIGHDYDGDFVIDEYQTI